MHVPRLARSLRIAFIATGLLSTSLAIGCPEPDGDLPEPQPDAVEPAVVVPDPVEETVTGDSGGTVTIGEGELDIPADAVEGDVEVTATATPPEDVEDLPNEGVVEGLVYDFGPDGLAFEEPADIALPAPANLEEGTNVAIAFLDEDTGEWVGIPTLIEDDSLTAKVHHFTKYAVVAELEEQCSLRKCGQSADLEGYWKLVDPAFSGDSCKFAEKAQAACVQNWISQSVITDSRLLISGDTVAGSIETDRNVSYTVPVGCESAAFGEEFETGGCNIPDPDGGVLDPTQYPQFCVPTSGFDATTSEAISMCSCGEDQRGVDVFLAGDISTTEDGRIALTWTDEATDEEREDELYFCRNDDFLEMYGVSSGSTMVLRYVLVGSASDNEPPPLESPSPRARVTVIPGVYFGTGVSHWFRASNRGSRTTTVDVTVFGEDEEPIELGPLSVDIPGETVVRLWSSIYTKLIEAGVSGSRHFTVQIVTSEEVEITAGYNNRGDRVRIESFDAREVTATTQYFPFQSCQIGTSRTIGVYNPNDVAIPVAVSAREYPSDNAIDVDDLVWLGLDGSGMIPPHHHARVRGFCDDITTNFSFTISSAFPIHAWSLFNSRGDRVRVSGIESGATEFLYPMTNFNQAISHFGSVMNTSDEEAIVTIEIPGVDPSTPDFTQTVTIPAGSARRIILDAGTISGLRLVRIFQATTTANLVTFLAENIRGDRVAKTPFVPNAAAAEWVVPFIPSGYAVTIRLLAASDLPTDLTARVFDDRGEVYTVDLDALEGGGAAKSIGPSLYSNLLDEGFDGRSIYAVVSSPTDTPFYLGGHYNVRGDRVPLGASIPRTACDASGVDSDGDGVVDCAEACPDDPEKFLPGRCGCGVEDADECPEVDAGPFDGGFVGEDGGLDAGFIDQDAGFDGGLDAGVDDGGMTLIDAGAPDAGPIDAGAPDAGPIDAGPIDAGAPDAGPIDAGAPDAGPIDAGAPDAGPVDAGAPDAGPIDAGPPPPPGECSTELNEADCTAQGHCFWNNNTCGDNPDADCTSFEDETSCDEHNFCFWNGQACQTGGATCDLYPTQVSCEAQGSLCEWDGTACADPVSACDGFVDEPACEANVACDWDFGFCGEDPFGNDDCAGFDGDQFGCESSSGCLYHQGLSTCHDSCFQFTDDSTCDASGGSCAWNFGSNLCESNGGTGDCSMYFDEFECEADPSCTFDFILFECVSN